MMMQGKLQRKTVCSYRADIGVENVEVIVMSERCDIDLGYCFKFLMFSCLGEICYLV